MTAELTYSDDWLQVWSGDCRDAMQQMPEQSVHTVITSPPFYGLRDYSNAVWEGGDVECEHEKVATGRGTNIPQTKNPGVSYPIAPHRGGNPNECVRCGAIRVEPTTWGGDPEHEHEWADLGALRGGSQAQGATSLRTGRSNVEEQVMTGRSVGSWCDCGAWRGALGLEPTFAMYVEHLVEVFRGVRRVLRDDGIAWLNLGDSYVAGATGDPKKGSTLEGGGRNQEAAWARPSKMGSGLPSKNLIGIPWRVAFALQDDGWILRQDIVWNKLNPMPESVEDRPTRSHEFVFMLTKNPTYFYDHVAVKEPVGEAMLTAAKRKVQEPGKVYQHDEHSRMGKTSANRVWSDPSALARIIEGRNKRDVWTLSTVPYPGAHYAVFPPKLVEPMIKAATSEKGCCSVCGAAWKRVVERVETGYDGSRYGERAVAATGGAISGGTAASTLGSSHGEMTAKSASLGWERTCNHEAEPVPCTVLDPFGGSGTTAVVAQQLGRKGILIDLNPKYGDLQMQRNRDIPLGL